MADATLPADTEKAGNVWCEACQQSLPASRAAAHLSSKKHQQALAPPAEPKVRATKAPGKARAAAEADEPAAEAPQGKLRAPAARKAATPGGLTPDPSKAGHYWCGICCVSLPPAKAEGHATTARHKESERKTLQTAIRAPRADGK